MTVKLLHCLIVQSGVIGLIIGFKPERRAFFASEDAGRCGLWSCQNICGALMCLLGGVCVGFGTGLCGRVVGVPVGAGCAPLVAGLFLF